MSITDGYRSIVVTYMNGMRSSTEHYKKTVMRLHSYYERYSGMGTMTFGEFQDQFVSQFVPSDYYADFTNVNKDKAMRDILADIVAQFGSIMSSKEVLMSIIDDHMNPQNISALQERIVEVMLELRDGFYSKFVDEIAQSHSSGGISAITFGKLKAEYVLEKRCRMNAEKEREKLAGITKQLIDRAQLLDSQNSIALEQINSLKMECEQLRAANAQLQAQMQLAAQIPTHTQIATSPTFASNDQVEKMRRLRAEKLAGSPVVTKVVSSESESSDSVSIWV